MNDLQKSIVVYCIVTWSTESEENHKINEYGQQPTFELRTVKHRHVAWRTHEITCTSQPLLWLTL